MIGQKAKIYASGLKGKGMAQFLMWKGPLSAHESVW